MVIAHHLGFPRIGSNRNLKWALERYWKGEITRAALEEEGRQIRLENWQKQINAGLNYLSVGDFSWYDHVLDLSTLLGVIPERFLNGSPYDRDTYFRMARGRAPTGSDTPACEMTKWFDTNYHYIVPRFNANLKFQLTCDKLFQEIEEAKKLGKKIKPILLGPLSYLWLGKTDDDHFDKLNLLPQLQTIYLEILNKLQKQGIDWVQIDEPILVLDLPLTWQKAFRDTYETLQINHLNLLLTTYFGELSENLSWVAELPTAGLHLDLVRGKKQAEIITRYLSDKKILSAGVVNGRNIWRNDLRKSIEILTPLYQALGDRLWVASSCSLLHSPVDLESEKTLDPEIKNWLAFATQKLSEISILSRGLNEGEKSIESQLKESDEVVASRKKSNRIHNPEVKKRCQQITPDMVNRDHPYPTRKDIQDTEFRLPLFPTTTIGSFPQTSEIRVLRQNYKSGKIDKTNYTDQIKQQIKEVIHAQEELGLDVFVHGESERNDMVEYFGELLNGFAFTQNGWVQSYGSRCVKPPIIYGDVYRAKPMTTEWIQYAQSLTKKPVKGMLTGPITILCWSFVRDDQTRFETATQIALALRDEVKDLCDRGIKIIQIDEPAFREGLPLREKNRPTYLKEAVYCFRLSSCTVPDEIQIHTHMCYSEFNDTIEAIAELDADVITIETSRSDMELLKAFETFKYPNDIGPGVYDIHSPRIPTISEMVALIEKAAKLIPVRQLWVNPDCGLKTRDWTDTKLALKNMVEAAKQLRNKYATQEKKIKLTVQY